MLQIIVNEIVSEIFPHKNHHKSPVKELCYAIAHRKLDQIPLLIQKIAQDSPELFNKSFYQYQLTPLHVCVIVQDYDTATQLLAYQVEFLPDAYLWTPLHHAAALQDERMKALLLSAQKTDDQSVVLWKNDCGGTYLDIERSLIVPKVEGPVFSFLTKNGNVEEGNADLFKEMTGAAYCPEVVVTSTSLLEEWLCPHERAIDVKDPEHQLMIQFVRDKLEVYRANKPKLILSKQNLSLGCDVLAGQDFQPGDIITVFGGLQKGKAESRSRNYVLGNTDGQEISNLGSRVNDGFPNCTAHCIYDVDGISELSILVACDPIKKGDRICWNYGSAHDIKKKDVHLELREEAMELFFKEFPPLSWIKLLEAEKENTVDENFITESFIIKLRYLFETPTSLITCIFKGYISIQEIRFLLSENLFHSIGLSNSQSLSLLYLCQLIEDILRKATKEDQTILFKDMLSLLNGYTYETLLVAFAYWTDYPISIGSTVQIKNMENELKSIGNLVTILNSTEANGRKAARMAIAFQRMPTKLKDDLFGCFLRIVSSNYPDFMKDYKKIYEKLNRI